MAATEIGRLIDATLPTANAHRTRADKYGERWQARAEITGPNGRRGTLVTGWRLSPGDDPR
ncbi:MAG TPA: hypothetical protein VHC49_01090, partial [Mycobacteriales bacterium]|nr:hypothetical protein [Mycobacteriales bacterium]